MWILTAMMLGLVSSLHCVGMCGPLMLALPAHSQSLRWWVGRLLYQLGRIVSYSLLGLFAAGIGQTFQAFGLQYLLSGLAAVVILIIAFFPVWEQKLTSFGPTQRLYLSLKKGISRLLQRHHVPILFNLGILNGFLPCGMVYAALVMSTSLPSLGQSIGFMALFGLSTFPLTFALMIAGKRIKTWVGGNANGLFRAFALVIALLLMLRSMDIQWMHLGHDITAGDEVVNCGP